MQRHFKRFLSTKPPCPSPLNWNIHDREVLMSQPFEVLRELNSASVICLPSSPVVQPQCSGLPSSLPRRSAAAYCHLCAMEISRGAFPFENSRNRLQFFRSAWCRTPNASVLWLVISRCGEEILPKPEEVLRLPNHGRSVPAQVMA